MRPAVHASILRNRSQRARRLHLRPHTFSLSRLLMMVFVGAMLFIPGLALSIVGIQMGAEVENEAPGKKIMYKAIGPTMCTIGVGVLLASCVYYLCYGIGDNRGRGVNQQGSLKSNESRSGSHGSSIQSRHDSHHHHHHHHHQHHHHENGNSLGSPDGVVVRRSSYKGENLFQHNDDFDEEAVPLASAGSTNCMNQPHISITIEEPSDDASSKRSVSREHVSNGDLRSAAD